MKKLIYYIALLAIFYNSCSALGNNQITFSPSGLATEVSLIQQPEMIMSTIAKGGEFDEEAKYNIVGDDSFSISIFADIKSPSENVTDSFKKFINDKNNLLYMMDSFDSEYHEGNFFAKLFPFNIKVKDKYGKDHVFYIPSLYVGQYKETKGAYSRMRWLLGIENANKNFKFSEEGYLQAISPDYSYSIVFVPYEIKVHSLYKYTIELRRSTSERNNEKITFNASGLANKITIEQSPKMDMISIDKNAQFSQDLQIINDDTQKSVTVDIAADRFPSKDVTNNLSDLMKDRNYIFYSKDKIPDPSVRFKEGVFLTKIEPFTIRLTDSNKDYIYNIPYLYLGLYAYGNGEFDNSHNRWLIGAETNEQGNGHFVLNKDGYLEFLANDRLSCIVFKPQNETSLDINNYDIELRKTNC